MSNITFERATPEAIRAVADNLRPQDLWEARALAKDHETTFDILKDSVDASWIGGCVADAGTPILLWGAAPAPRGYWVLWLVGTPALDRRKKTLLKTVRGIIPALFEHTKARAFVNFTGPDNVLHQAWIKAVGGTLMEPQSVGVRGELMVPFMIKRQE